MSTTWRPPRFVRPLAVGIIRRGDELLVMAVHDDGGKVIGWRPLGGTIEFGERAADALQREFVEELGFAVSAPKLLTVLENIYAHHGAFGHEIVFVFETAFTDPGAYRRENFEFRDGGVDNNARWVAIAHFKCGAGQLFPVGLSEKI